MEPELADFVILFIMAVILAFAAGLIADLIERISVSKRLLATAMSAAFGGVVLGAWFACLDI